MRYISLAYPIIILLDIIVYLNFVQWQANADYEFLQRQLDLQVNYSTTGAAQEMLLTGSHIETDYADWKDMTVEPEIALDTYLLLMIRNLGWSDTPGNREDLLNNYVPMFVVAAYDGYYVYGMQKEMQETLTPKGDGTFVTTKNDVYIKKWSPKLPYSETTFDENGRPIVYMYNLGTRDYTKYTNGIISYDVPFDTTPGAYYGTYDKSRVVISDRLTKACNSALFVALEGKMEEEWFIPSTFSEWSNSRSVDAPTILTYASLGDVGYNFNVSTFGIGGARLDESRFVIVYENKFGEDVYAYADYRDHVNGVRGIEIKEVVPSAKEAAERGYQYDIMYIGGVGD